MTRLAVLADIHSNLPALEAVFDDIPDVDGIVVAGDVVNWGPFSAQVMGLLATRNCAYIRGNNELYLTDWQTPRMPSAWDRFTLPPYTIAQLGPHWMNVIATWPDRLTLRFRDAPAMRVVHGTPRSPFEPIVPRITEAELAPIMTGVEDTFLIAAHTHLPMDRRIGPWHVFNPGSVGNPLDGNLTASYLLLEGDREGWRGTLRRLPFDVDRVLREFERTRFVEQCGVVGSFILDEYRTARPEVYPFIQWWQTTCPELPETMDLREKYASVEDREVYLPPHYRMKNLLPVPVAETEVR